MNIVVLQGVLAREPEERTLPSGDRLVAYEVTIRTEDQPTDSVPVCWVGAPDRALTMSRGDEVVVTGRVRRRFFRTPTGTGSRTEVAADGVVPARHAKRADRLVDAVRGRLAAPPT